jgi:hypothetical protein
MEHSGCNAYLTWGEPLLARIPTVDVLYDRFRLHRVLPRHHPVDGGQKFEPKGRFESPDEASDSIERARVSGC